MKARIYKPAKSAMQSGRANTKEWVLEYESQSARVPEPLMGWVSSKDTLHQVHIAFDDRDSAIAFARKHGIDFDVLEQQTRKIQPKSYLDNFRYTPAEDEKA